MKQFSVSDSQQTAPLFVRKTGHASFFFPAPPTRDAPGAIKSESGAASPAGFCGGDSEGGKRAESSVINPTGPAESSCWPGHVTGSGGAAAWRVLAQLHVLSDRKRTGIGSGATAV